MMHYHQRPRWRRRPAALVFFLCALALPARAATPVFVVNNISGSDTGASGAPANVGPNFAAAGCTTGGVPSATVTTAAGLTTGVPTDGSAAIWINTPAGSEHFWRITATTGTSVTVDTRQSTPNIAGGLDCAIGGRRASLSPDGLFGLLRDATNWEIQVETTGTTYALAVTVNGSGGNPANFPRTWIHGTGGRPTINWTANVSGFARCQGCLFENLMMSNSAAVRTGAFAIDFGFSNLTFIKNVIMDGWCNAFTTANQHQIAYKLEIRNAPNQAGCGGGTMNASTSALVLDTWVHNNSGTSNQIGGNRAIDLYNLVTNNNTAAGVNVSDFSGQLHAHTTIDTHPGTGWSCSTAASQQSVANLVTANNVGESCVPATGSISGDGVVGYAWIVDNNAYNANSTTYAAGSIQGPNDTVGTNPVYTNPGGNDYSIGPALQNRGWPPNNLVVGINSSTTTNTEPGASQRQGSGGGNYAY